MKHVIAIAAFLLLANAGPAPAAPATVHTSQNALDWAGVYRGVIPCVDCQGIETVVILKPDASFVTLTRYLGKRDKIFTQKGRFTWNAKGNTITLGDARFLVGENRLIRLAQNGTRIPGPSGDRYALNKVPEGGVTGRYWKLIELNGKPVPKLEQQPWFTLDEADKRLSGFGGCNNFSGSFTLDTAASRLSFGQIATSQKMCIAGMEVEAAFHQVLNTADNYSLAGDKLSLNRARMAPLARFEATYIR